MKQYYSRFIVSAFILLLASGAHAQIVITTIAGQYATNGYSGDTGPATAATLNNPSDVAFDAVGNLYFTDFINNVIRKIDTFGIITTIAGNGFGSGGIAAGGYSGDGGPATDAALNGPYALAIDLTGNIYFADGYNHAVRKVSVAGIISTFAGQNLVGYSGDGGPATAAKLDNPVGIALDKAGNVYIADDHNNVIRKVSTSGIISTVAGNTIAGKKGDGGPATAAELNLPIGVAFDTSGNLYIADSRNNEVRKVTPAGIISTYAGDSAAGYTGDGGLAAIATLDTPQRVSFDDSNNLYISDYYNNVIRKVESVSGIITTIAGNGYGAGSKGATGGYSGDDSAATNAELYLPCGVAFDQAHNIYIADRANDLIRRIGPLPPVVIDHTGVTYISGTQTELSVYPNPARAGSFTVTLTSGNREQTQMCVTNILGETVKKINTTTNQPMNFKLEEPAGVYFISATTTGGTWTAKITIE